MDDEEKSEIEEDEGYDDEEEEELEEEEEEEDEEELVLVAPDSDEESGSGEESGEDLEEEEGDYDDEEVEATDARGFDILNAIACAMYQPEDSDTEEEGRSVSDAGDDDEEEGGGGEAMAFSAEESQKITMIFHHCDTMGLHHLNEDQFGIALALLGQTESMDHLKRLYDQEAVADGLDEERFKRCLARLRTKSSTDDDQAARIRDAFDALYRGTCPNNDQKDFGGNRYIFAKDLRLLVRTTGDERERLTDEEADELIRECRPQYPKKVDPYTGLDLDEEDGIAVASLNGKIFFDQYRSMLLNINP